jgi:hypothetical protein
VIARSRKWGNCLSITTLMPRGSGNIENQSFQKLGRLQTIARGSAVKQGLSQQTHNRADIQRRATSPEPVDARCIKEFLAVIVEATPRTCWATKRNMLSREVRDGLFHLMGRGLCCSQPVEEKCSPYSAELRLLAFLFSLHDQPPTASADPLTKIWLS